MKHKEKVVPLWPVDESAFLTLCTRGKPLMMVIPPEGAVISCEVHPEGHFVGGPPRYTCTV